MSKANQRASKANHKHRLKIGIPVPSVFSEATIESIRSQGRYTKSLKEAEILLIRVETRVTKKWLARTPKLRLICTVTTGTDHIDFDACRSRGIAVISLKGQTGFLRNLPNTAELGFALLLSLARHLPEASASVKRGRWEQAPFRGSTLQGLKLGVVGFGRLGRVASQIARGFGMEVGAYDPAVDKIPARIRRFRSLGALAAWCDVLSIHAALTDKTHGLIGKSIISQLKPTSLLINTARGQLVDEPALLHALKSKRIAGAGLDVLADESHVAMSHPLIRYARTHHNLLISPHIGGQTRQAVERADRYALGLIERWENREGLR